MEKNERKKLIKLGHCKSPHGVKGAFSFILYNQDSSVLKKGFKVILFPSGSGSQVNPVGMEMTIESISFGNKTICSLKEVADRNMAEELIPFEIHGDRQQFPPLGEDEFYLSDLVNCQVVDEQGNNLGTVESIGSNGVQDILNVSGEEDLEILLIENFVKEIDLERKIIFVILPELI